MCKVSAFFKSAPSRRYLDGDKKNRQTIVYFTNITSLSVPEVKKRVASSCYEVT